MNKEAERYFAMIFGQANEGRDLIKDWVTSALDDFETTLKPEFPRTSDRYSLVVDRASYSNSKMGIKRGRFSLSQ